jgi:hypothetical protein
MTQRVPIIGIGLLSLLLPSCLGNGSKPKSSSLTKAQNFQHKEVLRNLPSIPKQNIPPSGTQLTSQSQAGHRYQYQRPPVPFGPQEDLTSKPVNVVEEVASQFPSLPEMPKEVPSEPMGLPNNITFTINPRSTTINPTSNETRGIELPPISTTSDSQNRPEVVTPEWPQLKPIALSTKRSNPPKPSAKIEAPIEVQPPSQKPTNNSLEIKPIEPIETPPKPKEIKQDDSSSAPKPIESSSIPLEKKVGESHITQAKVEIPVEPKKPESTLIKALRAYQEKQIEDANRYLKEYDVSNRGMLIQLLPLLARLDEGTLALMTPDELALHLDRLQGASGMLRTRAAMKAETVCFCRQVFKYGKYEPLNPNHLFQPGEPTELYMELRNFTWEPMTENGAKAFGMRLGSTLEIRDTANRIVWRRDLTTTDTRLSPPLDYYLDYRFTMPEMPPGTYTLIVQVVDHLDSMRRSVRRNIEIRMGNRQ